MNLAVAQEACTFESRNQAQYSGLLAELQMILEPNQIVGIRAQILLAQLHNGVRPVAGPWIFQSDGLHWSEAQRVAATACNLFNRQAALEVVQLLPFFGFDRVGGDHRIIKAVVFFFRHRAIDVVRRAFVVSRRQIHLRHVDRVGFDDGADGIVEI